MTALRSRGPDRRRLGWWAGKRVPRATGRDIAHVVALVGLASLALFAGHHATANLRPMRAQELAGFLDDLERPRRLPDAQLQDAQGQVHSLLTLLDGDRGIVAFYAPWCGPCQEELPDLVSRFAHRAPLVVITSHREDPVETRRKLDNLGLEAVPSYVDATDAVHEAGRVDALPTTFVITARGEVLERFEGGREVMLWRIDALLGGDEE